MIGVWQWHSEQNGRLEVETSSSFSSWWKWWLTYPWPRWPNLTFFLRNGAKSFWSWYLREAKTHIAGNPKLARNTLRKQTSSIAFVNNLKRNRNSHYRSRVFSPLMLVRRLIFDLQELSACAPNLLITMTTFSCSCCLQMKTDFLSPFERNSVRAPLSREITKHRACKNFTASWVSLGSCRSSGSHRSKKLISSERNNSVSGLFLVYKKSPKHAGFERRTLSFALHL